MKRSINFSVAQWIPFALCVVGAFVVLVTPHGGVGVVIRSAAFLALMAPMPGWTLVQASGGDTDWSERAIASALVSTAFVAAAGFLTTALFDFSWTIHTILLTVVVITFVTTVIAGPPVADHLARGALGFALALAVATSGGAVAVHLLAPSVPVETAFSMEVTGSHLTPTLVEVLVVLHSVGPSGPASVTLSAKDRVLDTVIVPRGRDQIELRGKSNAATGDLCDDLIKISAPNSTYLTPVMTCVVPPHRRIHD